MLKNIKIIHCRGHLPSFSAYLLKKIFNKIFIFDCRGLWADERLDNKSWKIDNFFYKCVYNFFKYFEKKFIKSADHIVVLTNKLNHYLIKNFHKKENQISVIPCAADYNKFKILDPNIIKFYKKKLHLENFNFIIGYVGSISNIYYPDRMIKIFLMCKKIYKKSKIIFLNDNFEYLKQTKNFKELNKKDYLLISPKNNELNTLYNIFDITLCFPINSFARIATSPTKLGESLASGTPVIANKGVGDVDTHISKIYKYGLLDINNDNDLLKLTKKIDYFKNLDKKFIRNKSKTYFSLLNAKKKYKLIYYSLLKYSL